MFRIPGAAFATRLHSSSRILSATSSLTSATRTRAGASRRGFGNNKSNSRTGIGAIATSAGDNTHVYGFPVSGWIDGGQMT